MKIKTNKHGQSGMTLMGTLIVLIVAAFFAVVLIKLVPLYMGNFKVKSVLNSMKEEQDIATMPPAEIEKRILSRLDINDVGNVKKEDIKIVRSTKNTVITVNYEARVNLFANLDAVAKFEDNRVELGAGAP